jgi:hypothetical protein
MKTLDLPVSWFLRLVRSSSCCIGGARSGSVVVIMSPRSFGRHGGRKLPPTSQHWSKHHLCPGVLVLFLFVDLLQQNVFIFVKIRIDWLQHTTFQLYPSKTFAFHCLIASNIYTK